MQRPQPNTVAETSAAEHATVENVNLEAGTAAETSAAGISAAEHAIVETGAAAPVEAPAVELMASPANTEDPEIAAAAQPPRPANDDKLNSSAKHQMKM